MQAPGDDDGATSTQPPAETGWNRLSAVWRAATARHVPGEPVSG